MKCLPNKKVLPNILFLMSDSGILVTDIMTWTYSNLSNFDSNMHVHNMSRAMRIPDFGLCGNKDANELRSNCETDQRLCFRYTDSTNANTYAP